MLELLRRAEKYRQHRKILQKSPSKPQDLIALEAKYSLELISWSESEFNKALEKLFIK